MPGIVLLLKLDDMPKTIRASSRGVIRRRGFNPNAEYYIVPKDGAREVSEKNVLVRDVEKVGDSND